VDEEVYSQELNFINQLQVQYQSQTEVEELREQFNNNEILYA
jgi:archaellum component FlaC